MLELLMQNWSAQTGSGNGAEISPKPSKDFASVMGQQALSLPIQALLAEAVQASSEQDLAADAQASPMPTLAMAQPSSQLPTTQVAVDAEGLLQQLDANATLQGQPLSVTAADTAEAANITVPRTENAAGSELSVERVDESSGPFLDPALNPLLEPAPQAQNASQVAQPALTLGQLPSDMSLNPTAVLSPAAQEAAPEAGAQGNVVVELARSVNMEATKETRSGPALSAHATRTTAELGSASLAVGNVSASQEVVIDPQAVAESVFDIAGNKAPINQQVLAVSSATPLLAGVAELSSSIAVSSIASLDSPETALPQSSASSLQTVAVQDLAAHALAVIRQRGHEQGDARLALHPAELGNLEMTIEQDGKRLDMSVVVDNEQARAAVSEQLNQLRERLAESGLKLASLDISLRDSGERQNNDKQEAASSHATQESVNNPSERVVTLSENALDLYA
ncbi:MAG: flagellar hook-length control protein FliK [Oceanococcus sp.]